ncbi:MAG: DUF1553 domain-containing protein [Pirellulaceae bacterium]|nr:DUF1553 domain-containing protein [Pirellulaceae bacterium]MDP7014601.1 DUF1553 domain-containing protein [Pirellulaceae bacterium]
MDLALRRAVLALLIVGNLLPVVANANDEIALLPAKIALRGRESRQSLIVQTRRGSEYRGPVAAELTFSSSDPNIARVEGGVVTPVADGQATITVKAGEQTATATVSVDGFDEPWSWSFRNHVQPILAKMGCSSGACHGALAGKGGFKLSLRGYDTVRDHYTITREARGRRIELAAPGRSLILTKPTAALAHKGGMRFDVKSDYYRVLSEWISAGAGGPRDDDARLVKIEVIPPLSVLEKGDHQQLLVRVHYNDGAIEDVTRLAKFTSSNEAVARVDRDGRVDVVGSGEGAVTAWFSSKIVIARVTSPFPNQLAAGAFANAPRRNFIDELGVKQLQRMNLEPSPRSSDAEFLRRVFIDTIGVLPTVEEARQFLADNDPHKRDKLIEKLLGREEFVDYWTYKWSDILMINGTLLRPEAVKSYYNFVRTNVKENTPWDEFVRRILTAQGDTISNGATNFYSLHQDPESMTENACQAFLGLSIGCAKCHNHPLEKWTNNQYYAMANLFARVRAKGWGGDPRSGDGRRTVFVASRGDLVQPLTGKAQPPTPLDGEPIPFDATDDRRVHLANWLTSSQNPYFARSISNRVWTNFLGVGLVDAVDDMRMSNPASNEELLSALAAHLVEKKFDLKALMREILQSETYQRSSQPLASNRDDTRFYSRYYPRRLMAEVLLDAISQVTASPSVFDEVEFPGADRRKTDFYPAGTRAIQLYDSAVRSYFLKTFGRNQRRITCECERSDEPSMVQVLHLSNGDTINKKLTSDKGRVQQLIADKVANEKLIEEAYLAALSRFPTEREKRDLAAVLAEAKPEERRVYVEDLFWGVLSAREFVFNH